VFIFISSCFSFFGDTVGIRIHKVDRANTDSNILPCKVLEINKVTDSKSVYKIFSKDGILKTYYSDEDRFVLGGSRILLNFQLECEKFPIVN
jgi:hypothetical protein